jgi:hypothetical protein
MTRSGSSWRSSRRAIRDLLDRRLLERALGEQLADRGDDPLASSLRPGSPPPGEESRDAEGFEGDGLYRTTAARAHTGATW